MENKEQEWIEAPDGWGSTKVEEDTAFDLFGSDDKSETFTYDIQLDKDNCKITLSGFQLDSDETDHLTGVTLWQAAPRLVLELGAWLGLCVDIIVASILLHALLYFKNRHPPISLFILLCDDHDT